MSNLELERAAMAPRRWIELCTSRGVIENLEQPFNDFNEMPYSRTRIIKDTLADGILYIVPGGRYLVIGGDSLSVWDLGCVSAAECKLVASVRLEDDASFLKVQATPDSKGLVILPYNV